MDIFQKNKMNNNNKLFSKLDKLVRKKLREFY